MPARRPAMVQSGGWWRGRARRRRYPGRGAPSRLRGGEALDSRDTNLGGTCSGSPQAVAIHFIASAGSFSDGSAQACVSGATAPPGSRSSTPVGEVCEEVTIDVV